MLKRINQMIHKYFGERVGFVGRTRCLERGCTKYHGTSPSQRMMFYWAKERDSHFNGRRKLEEVK